MKRRTFLTQAAALGASPLFANTSPVSVPKGKAEIAHLMSVMERK